MRADIHPNYVLSTVTCACGNTFQTRSTRPSVHLEICSSCHPFFTGRQKLVDSAGRVEKFTKRFEKTQGQTVRAKVKAKVATKAPKTPANRVMSTGAKKAAPEKPAKKAAPAKSK